MEIIGVVMVPDVPDENGDVMTAEEIAKAFSRCPVQTPNGTCAMILNSAVGTVPKGSWVLVKEVVQR